MNSFNRSTQRRLLSLPLLPTVWEGDRLTFADVSVASLPKGESPTCVLWADGVAGTVRAMEIASSSEGSEVMVRSLLHAMEKPLDAEKGRNPPGRPRKIVVRDRELHFFLRGLLQGMEIEVEYQAELPVINLLFEDIRDMMGLDSEPGLSELYGEPVIAALREIWSLAPWEYLQDHDVIEIQLQGLDLDSFYLSVLGNLGMEHGLLLYRSLESLQRFRQRAIDAPDDINAMQAAFLEQDCLFITYAPLDEDFDGEFDSFELLDWEDLEPEIGSIHPLEGVRSELDEDESLTLLVALQALVQFLPKRQRSLAKRFTAYSDRFEIQSQGADGTIQRHPVVVATLADLSAQLRDAQPSQSMFGAKRPDAASSDLASIRFSDDLIPAGAIVLLSQVEPLVYRSMQAAIGGLSPFAYQPIGAMPLLRIQTSKPKAQAIAAMIEQGAGLDCLAFLDAVMPLGRGSRAVILSLRLHDQNWQMVMDYQDGEMQVVRDRWLAPMAEHQGRCALGLYSGVSGKNQGNPTVRELVMLYETRFLSMKELGLPSLTIL
jgi:hypothetical protein